GRGRERLGRRARTTGPRRRGVRSPQSRGCPTPAPAARAPSRWRTAEWKQLAVSSFPAHLRFGLAAVPRLPDCQVDRTIGFDQGAEGDGTASMRSAIDAPPRSYRYALEAVRNLRDLVLRYE